MSLHGNCGENRSREGLTRIGNMATSAIGRWSHQNPSGRGMNSRKTKQAECEPMQNAQREHGNEARDKEHASGRIVHQLIENSLRLLSTNTKCKVGGAKSMKNKSDEVLPTPEVVEHAPTKADECKYEL